MRLRKSDKSWPLINVTYMLVNVLFVEFRVFLFVLTLDIFWLCKPNRFKKLRQIELHIYNLQMLNKLIDRPYV